MLELEPQYWHLIDDLQEPLAIPPVRSVTPHCSATLGIQVNPRQDENMQNNNRDR